MCSEVVRRCWFKQCVCDYPAILKLGYSWETTVWKLTASALFRLSLYPSKCFLTLEPIQSLFHSSISLFIWRLYLLCNFIHSLNATFYYLYLCSRLFGGQPVLQQQPITQSNTSHWKSAAETLHLQVSTWQKCVTTAYKRQTISYKKHITPL